VTNRANSCTRTVLIIAFVYLIPSLCFAQTRQQITPADIYERTHSSVVVVIVADANSKPFGQGSGFVAAKDRIVTNHHVIQGAREALVVFADGTSEPVNGVVADSPAHDLAILAVKTGAHSPLKLGDEFVVRQGESVYALGAPRGLESSLTNGIVSGFRNLDEEFMIQTTAPIAPGSSGGPLFDSLGRVIGVTTSFFDNSPGIYFSIGVSDVKRLLRTPNLVSVPLAAMWSEPENAEAKSATKLGTDSPQSKWKDSGPPPELQSQSTVGTSPGIAAKDAKNEHHKMWMSLEDDQIFTIYSAGETLFLGREGKGSELEKRSGLASCEFHWPVKGEVSWVGACNEQSRGQTSKFAAKITIVPWTSIEVSTVHPSKFLMIPINYAPVEGVKTGLYVTSDPPGADIFVNGIKQVTQTPAAVPLTPGEYNIVVRLKGHGPYAGRVVVKEESSPQLDVKLLPNQ